LKPGETREGLLSPKLSTLPVSRETCSHGFFMLQPQSRAKGLAIRAEVLKVWRLSQIASPKVVYIGNLCYLCTTQKKFMANRGFQVLFLDGVREFLSTLPIKTRLKVIYNVDKVKGGTMDSDLFKKLDGSDDIWEFRTKYDGM